MNNRTRLNRLNRLRAVVELHKGKRGKPVRLNGVERRWDMRCWDCGTSACALGCYALTPFGQRHFTWDDDEPICKATGTTREIAGADHFGISGWEARFLFLLGLYGLSHGKPVSPTKVIRHIDQIIRKYERGEGDEQ